MSSTKGIQSSNVIPSLVDKQVVNVQKSDLNISPQLMQQAFQKNAMGFQVNQTSKQSQSNLNLSQNYNMNNRTAQKNDAYNFTTVTANTGSMIVNNQPLSTKIDPGMVANNVSGSQKAQTQNRISNKSKCLSDSKHAYANVGGNNHFASKSFNPGPQKYAQSNHHTLQCISDINEFKQKINMVLQTQAFPQGIQQAMQNPPNEVIPMKALTTQVQNTNSLNPTSRLGYSQQLKHQSPTPNFSKSNMFQKRTIKTQNNAIYNAEVMNEFDSHVNSAFQSFKHNIRTNAFVPDGSGEQSQQIKLAQGTYLLRGQKEKNRNHHQQFKNTQSNSVQSAGEFTGGGREVVNNKLNQINYELKQLQSSQKKGYISNMLGHQQQYFNSGGNSAQQISQRRKIIIDYNHNQQVSEQNSRMKHQSPIDVNSQRNSRQVRQSVFMGSDLNNLQCFDFLDQLTNLNIELMDEKDKESLKEVCVKYCNDLTNVIKHQLSQQTEPSVSTKISTDQVTDNQKTKTLQSESKPETAQPSENKEDPPNPPDVVNQESSEQKFKENEKNLKEDRLVKESKIEIPMAPDNRKVLKSGTPHKLQQVDLASKTQSIEEIQNIKHEDVSIHLPNNKSQSKLTSSFQRSHEEGESDYITHKSTEKPMVPSLLENQDKFIELQKKLGTLSQFIENLDSEHTHIMALRMQQQQNNRINSDDSHASTFTQPKPSQQQEWINSMFQIKLFLNSLNCQKPTPQQINVMNNSKQRLDLFKVLQAREHVKFTNIQSEKMLNFHIKLENELEQRLKVNNNETQKFVNYLIQNGIQSQNKVQNAELLNQLQQKQIQSMYNLQQLKNMRKQQQNDQKAFSIFQMNELAQFRSMSDGQQKQILLNNLQQGKFDDFETLIEPLSSGVFMKSADPQMTMKFNKQEVILTIRNALEMLKKQNIQRNADELAKVNSQEVGELSPEKCEGQKNRNSMLTPKVDDSINETQSNDHNSGQLNKTSQNLAQNSEKGHSDTFEPQSSLTSEQIQIFTQSFDLSKQKFEHVLKQNMIKQQRIKIFCQQMIEAFGSFFANSRIYQQYSQSGLGIDSLGSISKNGLGGSDLDDKQKARLKARQSMGISNLPRPIDRTKSKPNVLNKDQPAPHSTANKDTKDKELLTKKEEKKEEDAKKDEDKDKTKENTAALSGEGAEETPAPEVKKPRYFPPKKLPNPFENAAQEQEKFLQARKEALAKYSMLSKNRFKQDENAPLKYVIRPGNNSRVIHKVMEKSGRLDQRYDNEGNLSFPGWETADDYYDSLYNFKWKPTSNGIKYDLISKHGLKQLVNHVRGHYSLTTKDNLFFNMKSYYETQKNNIYDVLPLTIVLDYLKDDVGDRVETFYNIMKIVEKNLESSVEQINSKMQELQIQREKSVKSMYKFSNSMHDRHNLWLLKPTGFNRGIGIHIFNTFDQLKDIMSQFYGIGRGAKDKTSIFQTHNQNHIPREMVDQNGEKQHKNFSFVLQKLIEKPMLFFQRKFDIRVWVLLNAADGKVYIYNEAYCRTSSKTYSDNSNLNYEDTIAMQLTNNAVQKEDPEYGKYEEGNIVSMDVLFNFIQSQSNNYDKKTKNELKEDFNQQVKKMVIESMKSVKGKIIQQKYTFELFGYDFIIDEDLNTWLIEINTNPCLEESNKLLKHLIPRMIDDLFNVTMDPLFYPSDMKYKSAFPLHGDLFKETGRSEVVIPDKEPHTGYKDNENLFRLAYTLEF